MLSMLSLFLHFHRLIYVHDSFEQTTVQYKLYYDHTFYPQKDSMTWTLDYSRKSDMDDVSGQWHVEERDNGSKTRVFCACDVLLREFVPVSIMSSISRAALKLATGWVKKQSELNADSFHVAEQFGYKRKIPIAVPV
jgi:hypothetical protein